MPSLSFYFRVFFSFFQTRLIYFATLVFILAPLLACNRTSLPIYSHRLDFQLKNIAGVNFGQPELKKQVSLVYFGFTTCPTVCPKTLKKIQVAYQRLGRSQRWRRGASRVLFITVDPKVDTAKKMQTYLSAYFSDIQGLSYDGLYGTEMELQEAARQFQTSFTPRAHRADTESSSSHPIAHSSYIFLVDREAQVRHIFRPSDSAAKIARVIRLSRL